MNSRGIAAKILIRVIQDKQFLTSSLEHGLSTVDNPQDRAFIQALCFGVIRHYFSLEAILNHLAPKPLKAKEFEVKILLLIGLYQLEYMRVKEHAAVSETVAALKRQTWAKGLLNGVFRRFIRERDDILQHVEQSKSVHNDHPDWINTLVREAWPSQADQILAANNQAPPMTLRVNQNRYSTDVYLQRLIETGIPAHASSYSPNAIILEQAVQVGQLPDFAAGSVSVQDLAAQQAARLLDLQAGHRVLDLCAAPGGKTVHILEIQPAIESLWAIDVDTSRIPKIYDNLNRLGLQATVKVGDATKLDWWDGQTFDRILVDAPCSALGVIRRHPDIKLLRQPDDIKALQSLQQSILDQAWQVLAPGGLLLYATCSILPQENELQMLNFMERHADAVEVKILADWGIPVQIGRQILPGMEGMDGFYYAKILKSVRS